MESAEPLPLTERLRVCALLWTEQNAASPARLGKAVMNDGGFFSRIESKAGTTTATLEKFARFFLDAENWPGAVPVEAVAFARIVGVDHAGSDTAIPVQSSAGKAGELSGPVRA